MHGIDEEWIDMMRSLTIKTSRPQSRRKFVEENEETRTVGGTSSFGRAVQQK